jgi:hypothetical protein
MISEEELKNAVASIEQRLKELDRLRERDKHDSISLKKWADQSAVERIKLQVLHYTEGITGMISEKHLAEAVRAVEAQIRDFERPREVDLFGADEGKDLGRKLMSARTKLEVLDYIAGNEKKLP